jgi:VWFA-related protein
MSLHRLTAILLVCVAASPLTIRSFEQKDPVQDTVIHINVDLVQVDATVVDSKDKPVTDLQAEDFTIFQDDKPQKITNFSFIRVQSPKSQIPDANKPTVRSKVESSIPPPLEAPLKQTQIRRTMAFLVDDFALSFDSTVRIRQSLKKWVDTEMQPGDLVAVIQTGVGVSALQQFTADKRMLHAAIDSIRYNAAGRVAVTSLSRMDPTDDRDGAVQTGRFNMENERVSTIASMGTIQYVADGLKDIPGRKSLIIFSESLKASFSYSDSKAAILGQWRGDQVVDKQLRRLIDAANRSTTVIHVIDPRGVINAFSTELGDNEYIASQDNMVRIAKETGGLFIRNTNDIDGGLKTAVDDGNGYYLIGYQPDVSTVEEMKKLRPKLHDIRVSVNRPGLRVRSRSRFLSVPSQEEAPKPSSQQERINQALGSPFTDEAVPVRLTALFFQTLEEELYIHALLHFDAQKLTFSSVEGDWHETVVDIAAATLDADGKQVDTAYKRGVIQARGKTFENMQQNGIAFLMPVLVKKPGSYLMRVVVYDNKSGQLGSATQFIDVPDVRKKELALSGIVLAAQKLKPTAFSREGGVIAYENSKGTAAVRIFRPGETIAWACQVLNAKTDSGGKPQLKIQVRLFNEGREIYPGKALEMATEMQPGTSRILATGQMQLKRLSPGYYSMQVIVFDALANKDHQMAVQSMDFEVQNPQGES